jgi:hypothetical protein
MGRKRLVPEYWGFCNGESLFIHTGFNAFEALKQQSTFEIFGAKHVSNYHNNPQQGDIKLVPMGWIKNSPGRYGYRQALLDQSFAIF